MPDQPSIEQLERRVKADPLSIAFAALAEEYRRAGRYEEAIDVCRTGLARHPAYISARVTLGRSLVAIGRLAEAAEELEDALRAAPENLAAIRALAEIHQWREAAHGTDEPQLEVWESTVPAPEAGIVAPSAEPKEAEPRHAVATHREEATQAIIRELQRILDGVLALKRERASGPVLR